MIVYGWNTAKFNTKRPKDLRCHNCNDFGNVSVTKFVKYANIYWIPLFPYRVINEVECHSCGEITHLKDISDELKRHYIDYKSVAPPFWSFSGIAIIIGLVVYGWISNLPDTEGMISKINNIEESRIFEFKTEDDEYSSFKVCSFDEDSIYIVYNEYQSPKQSDMEDVSGTNDFSKDTLSIDRELLLELVEDGTIVDVRW